MFTKVSITIASILLIGFLANQILVIPAGGHDSVPAISGLTSVTEIAYRITFDNSAIYTTQDPANQADINKLFGLSDCSSHHQTNSGRFGWRWYNNQLEIHAYNYVAGVRQTQFLQAVQLNQANIYRLKLTSAGNYEFRINGNLLATLPRGCTTLGGLRYYLGFYFGGDETAPHDISASFDDPVTSTPTAIPSAIPTATATPAPPTATDIPTSTPTPTSTATATPNGVPTSAVYLPIVIR